MKQPKNILVIIDPTATIHPAIDKAAILAAAFEARLELFICDAEFPQSSRTSPASKTAPQSQSTSTSARREMLEALAQPLRRSGLEVVTEATWTNPLYEGLLHKIAISHADLVLKDTHSHSLLGRTLLTNTDWHLIRSSPAPLLLVKPSAWPTVPRVLAAIDPGHHGDKPALLDSEILDWGTALTEHVHGELHAVHAYLPETSAIGDNSAQLTSTEVFEQEKNQRMEELNSLMWSCDIPGERLHLVQGAAADLLPAEAKRLNAAVIVMGAVSRSAIKRAFIGCTAEKVLDRLPCDVLIVKPFDFAADLPF